MQKIDIFYFAIVSHFKIYEVEVRNITCVWIAKFHFSFSYFLPFQCVYVGRKNWIIGYILCSKIDFLANKNPTFSLKYFQWTIKCNIQQLLGIVCNVLEAASNGRTICHDSTFVPCVLHVTLTFNILYLKIHFLMPDIVQEKCHSATQNMQ